MNIPQVSLRDLLHHPEKIRDIEKCGGIIITKTNTHLAFQKARYCMEKFFALPGAMRMKFPHDQKTGGGYTPPGIEGTTREGPKYTRHFMDWTSDEKRIPPVLFYNESMRQIYEELLRVGTAAIRSIDTTYKTDLSRICKDGQHLFRGTRYLNKEVDAKTELFQHHKDFGILTIYTPSKPGLEIDLDGKGTWEKVVLRPDSVLIGAGVIAKMYVPEIPAMRHQIMAHSPERTALFLFLEPVPCEKLPNRGNETAGEFKKRLLSMIRTDMKEKETV
jgi:isopenicillin N synthase-like dioxygenase